MKSEVHSNAGRAEGSAAPDRVARVEQARALSERIADALQGSLGILYGAPLFENSPDPTGLGIAPTIFSRDAEKLRPLSEHVRDVAYGFALHLKLDTIEALNVHVDRVLAVMPDMDLSDPFGDFFAMLANPEAHTPGVAQRPDLSESYTLFHNALTYLRTRRKPVTLASIGRGALSGLPYANVPIQWTGPTHPEAEFAVIIRIQQLSEQVAEAREGKSVPLTQAHGYDLLRTAQVLAAELHALA